MYLSDLNESARTKLAEVQALGYTVGENGLIADPGKFESEPFAAPLLWQIGLEGFSDTDESGVYEFEMSPAELADYGLDYGFGTKPLNGKTFYVQLSESDQGFVTLYMSQQSIAEMNGDSDDDEFDESTPEPEPAKPQRKTRKNREIDGLLISETFIDQDKGYQFGNVEPYEPFTENIGKLFRSLQREYGRCTGKVYVDTFNGVKAIGWVFEKRMQYDDARSKDDTYTREVWVTLHTAKPEHSVKYQYATL